MPRPLALLPLVSCLTACLVVPEGSKPSVGLGVTAASQYNFRGIPNNENGVVQGEAIVDLPTKAETGTLRLRAWSNFDLTNDTGDAWFPDGHGGEPSQIDLSAAYSERFQGFDMTFALVSYALQNPDDFALAPSGERGETKELVGEFGRSTVADVYAKLALHKDIDESSGWYANLGLSRAFQVRENWAASTSVSLGYSDKRQSDWNYGLREAGLADLRVSALLSYLLDQNTEIVLGLNASKMLDSDLQDWFDLIGLESTNVWGSLGVVWSY